ncbi:MAG: NAD-dependent epimerase/dehydratase family protein [Limisphaerales bacterium]
MKVLLTGASGFVGSHVLDRLRAQGIPTAVLLRPASNQRFINAHLPQLDVRNGSLSDPQSLGTALLDITHVIHCAGCVKALQVSEFYTVNQIGTRNVVAAVNQQPGRIQRLVHISSLAAGGPAVPGRPAREEDPPHPVSEYGRSKLAGEQEVRNCRSEHVILRPPAVYGPRDDAFLLLFKAVKAHILPRFGGGRLPLSFVFVKDLAETIVACLIHPAAGGKTFYAASPEITQAHALAEEIAAQMKTWTLTVPLPTAALWPLCQMQEAISRLTGRPAVLSRQKYAELRAPGWVCDPARLQQELGLVCATRLKDGIAETLAWYRQQGWL